VRLVAESSSRPRPIVGRLLIATYRLIPFCLRSAVPASILVRGFTFALVGRVQLQGRARLFCCRSRLWPGVPARRPSAPATRDSNRGCSRAPGSSGVALWTAFVVCLAGRFWDRLPSTGGACGRSGALWCILVTRRVYPYRLEGWGLRPRVLACA